MQLGAIDSINNAVSASDNATIMFESVEIKLNNELKPLIASLKFKIEDSQSKFDKANEHLNDYHANLMQNYTNALEGVSYLNEAVSCILFCYIESFLNY